MSGTPTPQQTIDALLAAYGATPVTPDPATSKPTHIVGGELYGNAVPGYGPPAIQMLSGTTLMQNVSCLGSAFPPSIYVASGALGRIDDSNCGTSAFALGSVIDGVSSTGSILADFPGVTLRGTQASLCNPISGTAAFTCPLYVTGGIPYAPTAAPGTNSTQVATAAFVAAAQGVTPARYFPTSSQTITLPSGWTKIHYRLRGAGGGSGCAVVTTSGTAASAGGAGGTGSENVGDLYSADVGTLTSISVTVGAAGTPCTASGTASGNSGSAATAGTATQIVAGSRTLSAGGGGAGSNGQTGAASAGGGGGSPFNNNLNGGNASGSTPGAAAGNCPSSGSTGVAGGVQPGSTQTGVCGVGGGGGVAGAAGASNIINGYLATPGAIGAGLAATPVAQNGARNSNIGTIAFGTGGNSSCTAGSQNATTGTIAGDPFYGVGGPSGASCTTANGGNGAAPGGYGASGGTGGGALVGFLAGSAGPSAGGLAEIEVQ